MVQGMEAGMDTDESPSTRSLYLVTGEAYPASNLESTNIVPSKQKKEAPVQESCPVVGLPVDLPEDIADRQWAKLCRSMYRYTTAERLKAAAALRQAGLEVPDLSLSS